MKLYKVTFSGEYYVRAPNERIAETYADDYLRDSYDLVESVREVTDPDAEVVPAYWEGDSLVYGPSDMTLDEAFRRLRTGQSLD